MKKAKKILLILILIIGISTLTFFIGKKIGITSKENSTSTTIENVQVGKQNITKSLTSSGKIETATDEKLNLSTSYYFETMCVEKGDMVKKGENILKYTNGTYLTAPYDLVVSDYSVPETKKKASSNNFIEVQNTDDLKVSLDIKESEISNLSLEQEVEIALTADSSKTYKGKITKIDSLGTYAQSGTTFPVEVSFSNDGNAKIGMTVSCSIRIKELNNVLAVPIDAVQISGDRKYVLVVENGKTKETQIQTGISDDKYVEVKSGLAGNETIQVEKTTKQNSSKTTNNRQGMQEGNGFRGMGGGMPGNRPNMGQGGKEMNAGGKNAKGN